jgi:hypothetical protein
MTSRKFVIEEVKGDLYDPNGLIARCHNVMMFFEELKQRLERVDLSDAPLSMIAEANAGFNDMIENIRYERINWLGPLLLSLEDREG